MYTNKYPIQFSSTLRDMDFKKEWKKSLINKFNFKIFF